MKSVLVYLYKNQLAPTGGPLGYNYNLNVVLEKMGVQNIHFIETEKGNARKINQIVEKIRNPFLKKIVKLMKSFVRNYQRLYGSNHRAVLDLNKYDIVHFHSVSDMYSCKDDLKDYKGLVLLTSHAPDRPSLSVYNMLSDFERKYMHWFYKKMFEMDEYAFKRADYIIFPCPEAEEPYLHNWPTYETFRKNNDAKYRYFLTGINKCSAKLSSDDVRAKYNIPKEAFVVCYVGRHNEIKGYDLLKQIGSELLEQGNIYFLIAGKEEPMQGIRHPRWIEIGWTNDPHSLINASDIFLLPNKETYFDLVMLEILSLGTIVLASHTGGNKYFEKMQPNGVILFQGKEDAVKKTLELKNMSRNQKALLRELNRKMFAEHFTAEIFTQSYLDLINSL